MAIAFDNSAKKDQVLATTSTLSYTTSGTDRFMYVSAMAYTTDQMTGVTYNGVALTLYDKQQIPGNRWAYLWYLVAPATGTNDVVVTLSGSNYIAFSVSTFTGVQQTSTIDVGTKQAVSNTQTVTTSVTTTVDNCWLLLANANNVGVATAGTNTTKRTEADATAGTFDSNGARATGSNSVQVDQGSATAESSSILIAIKPRVTVNTFTPRASFIM